MILSRIIFYILIYALLLASCDRAKVIDIPIPQPTAYMTSELSLTDEVYYDKVLGAIVGSAIGDAMGASTEMWTRSDIQTEYGFINGLTTATREKSPEGTWRHNMTAGATTDDTRWKYLMGQYIAANPAGLNAKHFTQFIAEYYQSQTGALADVTIQQSTDALDGRIEQINWIKEWARVAIAYKEGGLSFERAQARFYGGEMSCAGMLYSPMFGLVDFDPESAYESAFEHTVFDIGYAKDLSGLTAAMTSLALHDVSMDSIIDVIRFVDPYDYKDSRLIGRLAESIAKTGLSIVTDGAAIEIVNEELIVPTKFQGSALEWTQLQYMYDALEGEQQAIAFHAGEIWQILITGLKYGKGDFEKTMQFIVNYGRDNDTVAAVAGMILGGKIGFSNLPIELKTRVLTVSKEIIGINLEVLAATVARK